LKNAISRVTTLNPIPPKMRFLASGLGARKNNTSAVSVMISPKKCRAEKNTATLNGRFDCSERPRENLALGGGREWLGAGSPRFITLRQILEIQNSMQYPNSQVPMVSQSFHHSDSALLTGAGRGFTTSA